MLARRKVAMILAEFLGTGVLTFVILAVSKSSIPLPYFISLASGLTVGGLFLMLGNVSGAHLNPAITIGLWSARRVKTLPAIVYILAQMLGGAGAYLLATYLFRITWKNSGHFDAHVLVAEALGAFVFSMGWAAVAYRRVESNQAASVIGLSLIIGMLIASTASSGLINPAVALGTRTWVLGSTVLGPILGAIVGFNLFGLLFAGEDLGLKVKSRKR